MSSSESRIADPDSYFPGAGDVGVIVSYCERYLPSIFARICDTLAPELCICIASRATSRQIPQVMPWGSHVGVPFRSRLLMKQSSLSRWPAF
jgi:hypothetical protein